MHKDEEIKQYIFEQSMGQSEIKKKLENILRQAKWKYSLSKLRGYSGSNTNR